MDLKISSKLLSEFSPQSLSSKNARSISSDENSPRIAISGLHRGENPQPGASIIRSIRRRFPNACIIGLVYDAMESGIYVEDGPNEVHLMPYPAAGARAFFERLNAIRARSPFDIFIPTLDSEIELLSFLHGEFSCIGLRVCLPEPMTLRRRAKQHLPELAAACDAQVPETRIANDVPGALRAAWELGWPVVVKGPFYDAKMVNTEAELSGKATRLLSEWGAPVILQRCVSGPEFNALGLGDGRGGLLGLCCIRKTLLSEKGKGQGGVTVEDRRLTELCERVVRELRWHGPFELELIRDDSKEAGGVYVLIEMNPRFPAWVDFPSMLGANFSAALVEMLSGKNAKPLSALMPGQFYVRHQIEVVGRMENFAALFADAPNANATAFST